MKSSKLTSDDHIKEMIWMQQKAKIDRGFDLSEARQDGREEGREEGRQEGVYTVAKNMKKLGVDISIIISSTGLSEKEINNI